MSDQIYKDRRYLSGLIQDEVDRTSMRDVCTRTGRMFSEISDMCSPDTKYSLIDLNLVLGRLGYTLRMDPPARVSNMEQYVEVTELKQRLGKLIASATANMSREEMWYRLEHSDYSLSDAKYISMYPLSDTLACLGELADLLTRDTYFELGSSLRDSFDVSIAESLGQTRRWWSTNPLWSD